MIIRICKSCGEITEFESQEISKKNSYIKGGYCKACCLDYELLEALEEGTDESEEI